MRPATSVGLALSYCMRPATSVRGLELLVHSHLAPPVSKLMVKSYSIVGMMDDINFKNSSSDKSGRIWGPSPLSISMIFLSVAECLHGIDAATPEIWGWGSIVT
eukprot:05381_3